MKKLFLFSIFVFSTLMHADPIENLEQAIKEGNISQVKSLLKTTTLSNAELAELIDLTQQIMDYNKEQLSCYKHTLGLSESPFKQIFSFLGGCAFIPVFLAASFGIYDELKNKTSFYLPATAAAASLISSILSFRYCFKLRENAYHKWQNGFDNTLTIKQLLSKHKNQGHQPTS